MPTHSTSIDLDVIERTLNFIDIDGADEKQIELIRLYLPFANGSALPQPAIIEVLEGKAGGTLAVGWLPVRSSTGGLPAQRDITWCVKLAEVLSLQFQLQRKLRLKSIDPAERRLAKWVDRQKQRITNPKVAPLTSEQANLIRAIPDYRHYQDQKWYREFDEVREWIDNHRRLPSNVTRALSTEERRAALWMADNYARLKRSGRTPLSPDQKEKFLSLPGVFVSRDSRWDQRYREVQAFLHEHGNLPTSSTVGEGQKLYIWLSVQRRAITRPDIVEREGRTPLTNDRRKQLLALDGFVTAHMKKMRGTLKTTT